MALPPTPLPPANADPALVPPPGPDDLQSQGGYIDANRDGYDDRDPRDKDRAPKPHFVPKSKLGMGLELGGGITNFFAREVQDTVDPGPEWSARLVVGTRSYLGAEASYIGSTQTVNGLGFSNQGQLVSNGVRGLARLNFTKRMVQPYLGAGIGYRHFQVYGANVGAGSEVTQEKGIAEVPATTGIALRARGFVFDTRFHVGIPISRPIVLTDSNNYGAGTTWGVNGNLGFEL
ncbi:MAG: hypothetical protein JNK82_35465 [Myxococcaceae bacterium]|nr:hypothetical protein [Myxococcaceae bacterium]